jgi:hypothetical protein
VKVIRWIGIGLGVLALLLAGVAVAARFSDGPIGAFAGGPLVSEELVPDGSVDWSFAEPLSTIEFQLEEPPRSRTVWFVLHEGALYVPCGMPNFTLWKQWPHEALADGRSVLRVEGRRYERQAVRVTDPDVVAPVLELVTGKYGLGDAEDAGPDDVWIFRMDPRSS